MARPCFEVSLLRKSVFPPSPPAVTMWSSPGTAALAPTPASQATRESVIQDPAFLPRGRRGPNSQQVRVLVRAPSPALCWPSNRGQGFRDGRSARHHQDTERAPGHLQGLLTCRKKPLGQTGVTPSRATLGFLRLYLRLWLVSGSLTSRQKLCSRENETSEGSQRHPLPSKAGWGRRTPRMS